MDRIEEWGPEPETGHVRKGAEPGTAGSVPDGGVWLGLLLGALALAARWFLVGRPDPGPLWPDERLMLLAGVVLAIPGFFLRDRLFLVSRAAAAAFVFSACLSAALQYGDPAAGGQLPGPFIVAAAVLLTAGLRSGFAACCGVLAVLGPGIVAAGPVTGETWGGLCFVLLLPVLAGVLAGWRGNASALAVSVVGFHSSLWALLAAGRLPGFGAWGFSCLTAAFGLFSLSVCFFLEKRGRGGRVLGLLNLAAYAAGGLAAWRMAGSGAAVWAAWAGLFLLAAGLPFRSGAGMVRDGAVVFGLFSVALMPGFGIQTGAAAACLLLALAANWKADGGRIRRAESFLLLLVLAAGLLPDNGATLRDVFRIDLSAEWAGLLGATVLLLAAGRIHEANRREFGASVLGLLCPAVAALLWIRVMVGTHGAEGGLPFFLCAVSALFLGAGWLLGSAATAVAAMLPLIGAQLCFHVFNPEALSPGDAAAAVLVTFLAARAWEGYLLRHRAVMSWDLLALSMLPWWGGLLLAERTLAPVLGLAGALPAVCALAAVLPALLGRGRAGVRVACCTGALLAGGMFVSANGAAGSGPWETLVVCLSLLAVAGSSGAFGVRGGGRALSAAALLLGVSALALLFLPFPLSAGHLGAAWCMAAGLALFSRSLESMPVRIGGMLALALATTLTLCQVFPALRAAVPGVFAVVAGGVLLSPGLRRAAFSGRGGRRVHDSA